MFHGESEDLFMMDPVEEEPRKSTSMEPACAKEAASHALITPLESNWNAIEHAKWDVRKKLQQKASLHTLQFVGPFVV